MLKVRYLNMVSLRFSSWILIGLAFFFIIACTEKKYMEEKQLETMLKEANFNLNDDKVLETVEKKEYSFINTYISANNYLSRELTIYLLQYINQPWCFKYYQKALQDEVHAIRNQASKGIYKLNPAEQKEQIYKEIDLQNKKYMKEDNRVVEYLILTIGNIGDKSDIEPLLELEQKEPHQDIKTAYQMALTKLGFPRSINEIKRELQASSAREKLDVFDKIEYINNAEWIPIITPFLLDEEVADYIDIGDEESYAHRVCDHTIYLLRIIDPDKQIPKKKVPLAPHSDEELAEIRGMYDLQKNH